MKNILVTGGAGYIGSHICLHLQAGGFHPIVLDNFSNGHRDALAADIPVIDGDIRDQTALDLVFERYHPDAVIHMAALIEAGVSMREPARFYDVNTHGSMVLLDAMRRHDCNRIVFSSTAAVYGNAGLEYLDETLPIRPESPYGKSKAMVETILADYASIYGFHALALRYFNAAGADPAGRAGERHDPETHLIPLALQAAAGLRDGMKIFGTDYDTPDGTCIRDYIHVDDLANAHIAALHHVIGQTDPNFDSINIGTGDGCSVKDIMQLCQDVTGRKFAVTNEDRRDGDPARLIANPAKAKAVLGWTAKYTDPRDIIAHAWAYFTKND
ncbi:UDP-glucose 4-epimerase GalE [Thalassospira alkalitolerans]|uniref:UDP-glucose 4-epimerase n=1 Tax=Thalassospira alkalitolerans TaxID=1293890 RepID=A0A1Y2LFM3_9PROT|nr:UDP-glucose 4-epimerase GalE [Thalassospira alkalitolerans]OSQ50129.1 UDP-glucose 4-epimerase [Thalassospira alkalitolerans]